MRNLINFLLRHSSWIVLAIYVAISCVLLFGRNPYQRSIYLSSANQVASAVYDLQSEVTSYFGLREVNRDLQLRNGELEMEVINLKEQLNRYRSSVGKDTIPFDSVLHDYDFAVARVVNNSVAQINNYITIDKGRAEGIEPEQGKRQRLFRVFGLGCGESSLRRIRGDASACGVCSGRYDCHERLFVCVSRRNYGGYNQRL